MKIQHTLLLATIIALPLSVRAGQSVDINIKNNINPTDQQDATYPRITAHSTGGSSCWNDYGLADWNQFAPSGGSVFIHTEANGCLRPAPTRQFTLFMQATSNQPWIAITPNYKAYAIQQALNLSLLRANGRVWENISDGNESTRWFDQPAACGLAIIVRADTLKPGRAWFEVRGTPAPNCTGFVYPEAAPASTASASDPAEPISIIPVNMSLGQKKTIKLRGLDSGSVWILGECTGDAVLEDDVVHHHTLKKVLPSTVTVKATGRGTESCDVLGVHYPENTPVVTLRYQFIVK